MFSGGMLVVSVSVAGLVTLAAMTQPALAPEAKHSLLQYVTGKYLLPSNCRVHFEWEEPQLVGETMTFNVKVKYQVFILLEFFLLKNIHHIFYTTLHTLFVLLNFYIPLFCLSTFLPSSRIFILLRFSYVHATLETFFHFNSKIF